MSNTIDPETQQAISIEFNGHNHHHLAFKYYLSVQEVYSCLAHNRHLLSSKIFTKAVATFSATLHSDQSLPLCLRDVLMREAQRLGAIDAFPILQQLSEDYPPISASAQDYHQSPQTSAIASGFPKHQAVLRRLSSALDYFFRKCHSLHLSH